MKEIIYIDCFSGISGDMMVGALLDLGVDIDFLRNELRKLDIGGYNLTFSEVKRGSFRAKKFNVEVTELQSARNYRDIKKMIDKSRLDKEVKEISGNIFQKVAEAEALVHGYEVDKVHFHEVGAVDSIVDITGTAVCLNKLKIDIFYSNRVPTGKGFVNCAHGKLPVPAPATMEILKGIPAYGGDFDFEVTTPTGAAIIKALVAGFGDIPFMKIKKIGYGAGSNENKKVPNVLRLLKGTMEEEHYLNEESLILLSSNIDDSSPEIMGYLMEKLFENEALDAWIEPIYMKKTRPAFKINVLCERKKEQEMIKIILMESTTLGVRSEHVKRFSIIRKVKTARLSYGEVKVKVGILKDREINISPEFESCKKLAQKTGKPLKEIYHDAVLFFSRR
jgi:pyridinium-3,5-bisthiocarboxylic acid mononucleotide nickel chelatase